MKRDMTRYDVYSTGDWVDLGLRELVVSLRRGERLSLEYSGAGEGELTAVLCVSSLTIDPQE